MIEEGMSPDGAPSSSAAAPRATGVRLLPRRSDPPGRDRGRGRGHTPGGHTPGGHTPGGHTPVGRAGAHSVRRQNPLAYAVIKRALDIFIAGVGLLVLLPVFAIIALSIKLEDGGPILYRREVVGLRGARMYAWKFRTMIPDADAYLARRPHLLAKYLRRVKLLEDPRVTRVGSFLRRASLDELPQLFNVLCGQMSLVGPRIIHPSEVARFGALAVRRQEVLPGITGLWQVRGRQSVSYVERVRLDEEYLDRRSLWLDLCILVQTVPAVVRGRGAC